MSKKKEEVIDSIIAIELKRFEKKVQDFQDFIEKKPITDRDVATQIKVMDKLPGWLKELAELRKLDPSKTTNVRGDLNLSPLESGQI